MKWYIKTFAELTGSEVYEILKARAAVFVVEQNCPYLDPDGLDEQSVHIFALDNENIAAYCRITAPGTRFEEVSIGRVITLPEYRGQGLGRKLIERAIGYISNWMGHKTIRISAQSYLKEFYESFGFRVVSDKYNEDAIPHFEMLYGG